MPYCINFTHWAYENNENKLTKQVIQIIKISIKFFYFKGETKEAKLLPVLKLICLMKIWIL